MDGLSVVICGEILCPINFLNEGKESDNLDELKEDKVCLESSKV